MGDDLGSIRAVSGVSRRAFLGYSLAAVPVVASVTSVSFGAVGRGSAVGEWIEFNLRRDTDEVLLKVRAFGFRLRGGSRRLSPAPGASEHLLEFTLPPQHFRETTLTYQRLPDVISEADIASVRQDPNMPSVLLFRVPADTLRLEAASLLDFSSYELVLPDPTSAGEAYDLEIPRSERERFSRIEMPFGVELAPVPGQSLSATAPNGERLGAGWAELWSTAILPTSLAARTSPLQMEVFSVRGFDRVSTTGSVQGGDLVVTYVSRLPSSGRSGPTPLSSFDRAELAASLCRRFPYTGRIDPLRYSAKIDLRDEGATITAAFAPGRSIGVDQLRLSSRGGYLSLRTAFTPYPGSAISGWTHYATLGQDHFVEVVREGFLFPFGTRCQLVVSSQRIFVRDRTGRFVAPLNKQAFLRIAQPNLVVVGHEESPFASLSVTTAKSPALDPPRPGADPAEYAKYDFFLPMVDGRPFRFEHVGTDRGGDRHTAAMPMIFVSNRATAPNGLIWEPGYAWPPDASQPVGDPQHSIPKGGEGLRVVDRFWNQQPGRFASYGGPVVELARTSAKGQAAQRLDWVEWCRGNVPELRPTGPVAAPFRPRARTMRVRDQACGQLAGEPSALLATYRDVRFTEWPFLDPEPTTPPADYFRNVPSFGDDADAPFLFYLETRALASEPALPPARSPEQVAVDIRDLYFRTGTGAAAIDLFAGIDNEISFGRRSSADGIGGLSVPDTHACVANRRHGVIGDATFDERRWIGLDAVRHRLEPARRLDFAAYSRSLRKPLDQEAFQATRTATDRAAAAAAARQLMGFASAAALVGAEASATSGVFAPGLKLGDLFGADAELIPGMRFSDLFAGVALAGSDDPSGAPKALALADGERQASAEPLSWQVRLSGIEWLAALQESGQAPTVLPAILQALAKPSRATPAATPQSLGLEASLSWANSIFKDVDLGPAKFLPGPETAISIEATARIDFGLPRITGEPPTLEFEPGSATISARTEIKAFTIEIFGAIRLEFEFVRFEVASGGSKDFSVRLAAVKLLSPLDFINQLESMLGGLGGDNGIHISITPQRAEISQKLNFPSEGGMLLIGPAQVTNLAFSWMVTIPLMGRDVLSVAFGMSSRDKPLTIFVPPWYGGKAYALIEATTRGCRLVEISMEYGALVPIDWTIAQGEASLMAGIFFNLRRDDAKDTAIVKLTAFVKAVASLSVAGIIHFGGLVYIALNYITDGGDRRIVGDAEYSVSIKIAFVRVSYSFTATYEKGQEGGSQRLAASPALRLAGAGTKGHAGGATPSDGGGRSPFGPGCSLEAFGSLLAGYADARAAA